MRKVSLLKGKSHVNILIAVSQPSNCMPSTYPLLPEGGAGGDVRGRVTEEMDHVYLGTSPVVRTWECPEKEPGITRELSGVMDPRTGKRGLREICCLLYPKKTERLASPSILKSVCCTEASPQESKH